MKNAFAPILSMCLWCVECNGGEQCAYFIQAHLPNDFGQVFGLETRRYNVCNVNRLHQVDASVAWHGI